ncbi:class I SAM-dependent methyltransferase [Rufibacter latericius]|uniref:SAM-dependent methyltransferase n=1 Tax=Rufibacter latericius TaxID=2487040 RepID=A0A3M9MVW3_9BACT|nr:class I SAM-dependent methyltransferase [Rufibacter latericius]RNI29257.1 SAM-dependent methyltransferase [Rufibacter latericius]
MNIDSVKYPIYTKNRLFDLLALKFRFLPSKLNHLPLKCIVCNRVGLYKVKGNDLREDCTCKSCKSFNRQRQISYVMLTSVLNKKPLFNSLKNFISRNDLRVYYTESKGPIHDVLVKMKNYVYSEYFGEEYKSGDYVNGILHQDLQKLSFADDSFDVVISSEVFEHIPNTYQAFKEVHRVLKPGGRHIFTIPFDARGFKDTVKAVLDENGNIQYLSEPEFHKDPIREEGVLVYRIFSLEMLIKLNEIGFITNLHHLYNPLLGIVGNNAIVFESIKEL